MILIVCKSKIIVGIDYVIMEELYTSAQNREQMKHWFVSVFVLLQPATLQRLDMI